MPFTFNGCGTKFYGNRDKGEDGSHITTEWITLVYVPIIPIRSWRVLPVGQGTNYVVHSSQSYRMLRVPLCWPQIFHVYMFAAPIIFLVLFYNRHDLADWFRHDVLKKPAHATLQLAAITPTEQPLNTKDAALACGTVLKLDRAGFDSLNVLSKIRSTRENAGFTDQENKDFGDSNDKLEELAFQAYSFAYLTWSKPTIESRANFDKLLVKNTNSTDLSKLSADERALFESHMDKTRQMMLQSFDLGRRDARISPCPASSLTKRSG